MLPEITAGKVCLIRTADADCEQKVVIPRTLGIALNAVELAEDLWMGGVFDHVCIIRSSSRLVNRKVAVGQAHQVAQELVVPI